MLFLLLLLWSIILGWGLAQAVTPSGGIAEVPPENPTGTVDVVTERYQLGQQFYLENCSTCHIGLPPAVMPTQTWADLLQDSQHYGAQIQPLLEPTLQVVWNYISTYSRPVLANERVPYRLQQSRYFKALHPRVEFAEPVSPATCASCHPGATQFDFRSLTPEWQNAP
jgi:mono/diheme cytochrome c family protein